MVQPDAQLVAETLKGDDAAYDKLVTRYRSRVFYLALSKTHNREAALDIAQDVFVSAYTALSTLREMEKFSSWLTSITSNLCLTHLRRAREIAIPMDDMIAEMNCDIDLMMARQAIDALPNGTRSVAILYFVEEMKLREIAEFLDLTLPAVKSRVREARVRLQKELVDMVRIAAKKEEPGEEFNRSIKQKLELARYYREFSELIDIGTSLVRSLWILENGTYSAEIRTATNKARLSIEAGSTLTEAVNDQLVLVTPEAIGMMRTGEYGGTLEISARALAECIDAQSVVRDVELSYWCRSVGNMLSSGVPILSTLNSGIEISQGKELKQAQREMIDTIQQGQSIDSVLKKYEDVFPPFVRVALAVGEWSGTLDLALSWAADQLALNVASRLAPRAVNIDHQIPFSDVPEHVEAFVKQVITRLKDESASVRVGAIGVLSHLDRKEAEADIAKLITDSSMEVRKSAIDALAQFGYVVASGDIFNWFKDSDIDIINWFKDSDIAVRRAAVRAIAKLKLHDAAPLIANLIEDADPRVETEAIKALEALNEIDLLTIKALELLASEDWSHRNTGVCILRDHPSPEFADALIKLLEDDKLISWKAALALASIDRSEGLPVLLELVQSPNYWWTTQAAIALLKIGDPICIPYLRKAEEDGRLNAEFMSQIDQLESR